MSSTKYDCIIIGSGQAGTPLAGAYARAGKKTALIERVHIGGCCVNEGCTPTKCMVASGRAAYLTRRGADYGVHTPGGKDGEVLVDMLKVRDRKREIVKSFRSGNEGSVSRAGVEVLKGEASFTGAKKVKVKMEDGSDVEVEADVIYINTGERPVDPKLPGVEKVDAKLVLDSTSIQELDIVPEHLIVLGGGYVGLEFAQLFRRLGSQVTIIQRGKQLLPREDPDIADAILKILEEDGISIKLNSSATSLSPNAKGVSLTYKSTEEATVSGSHILFAAGRKPNTDMMNLPAAGIKTNAKGYIITNDELATSAAGIYALGDVKGPPAFTHISYDDFRIVQNNILKPSLSGFDASTFTALSIKDRLLPYVVYTDPQLGHVGLHEAEARAKFPDRKIKTAKMPMEYVARALETDESRGMMKATIDAESGQILGFTCLGIEGGEVMSMVQIAMMGGVGYERLQKAVFAHPALAESLNNLWGFLE
jgi:pyruvate/2-oxoglutarate dehydrogenase complex dihydrolipoamide dehydrogenase (E3) component